MTADQAKAQQIILLEDIRHLQKKLRTPLDTLEEALRLQELLEIRQGYFWTLEQIITAEEEPKETAA